MSIDQNIFVVELFFLIIKIVCMFCREVVHIKKEWKIKYTWSRDSWLIFCKLSCDILMIICIQVHSSNQKTLSFSRKGFHIENHSLQKHWSFGEAKCRKLPGFQENRQCENHRKGLSWLQHGSKGFSGVCLEVAAYPSPPPLPLPPNPPGSPPAPACPLLQSRIGLPLLFHLPRPACASTGGI